MAFPGTMVAEVRSTGNDLNGGWRSSAATGLDYGQQDSPQVTFDGATILAVTSGTSATITITGYTVSANDQGNSLRIAGGTNFTAGTYYISSVNTGANQWTLDRNCSSGIGAAMTGRMGGAIATIGLLFLDTASAATTNGGLIAYVKSATYTFTTAATVVGSGGGALLGFTLIGYTSTRTDGGRPTITTSTNSINLFEYTQSHLIRWINFNFSNTATVRAIGMWSKTSADSSVVLENCKFSGFTSAVFGDFAGANWSWRFIELYKVEITACTSHGLLSSGNMHGIGCYIYSNGADGVRLKDGSDGTAVCDFSFSIFYNNTGSGLSNVGTQSITTTAYKYIRLVNNTIISNGADGVTSTTGASTLGSLVLAFNNIFWGNGVATGTGYGLNTGGSNAFSGPISGGYNAYGGNQTGARNSFPAFSTDITITASPVTSAGSDFGLNSNAGGGALCKGAGYPGILGVGSTVGTGAMDLGAVQSGGASATVIVVNQNLTRFITEPEA